ncbi:MAG: hypothetical protein AAGA96_08360 [Verrucomicrobiota bacterium]
MINISQVAHWEDRVGLLRSGSGETRIQKALASLSQIASYGLFPKAAQLFYAMQGLEAFYCEGVGDLRNQLARKIRILLGDWPGKNNRIAKLYDFRSKYVHGSYCLEFSYFKGDPAPDYYSTLDEVEFAVALLLASLQECIRKDATEIQYSTTISLE